MTTPLVSFQVASACTRWSSKLYATVSVSLYSRSLQKQSVPKTIEPQPSFQARDNLRHHMNLLRTLYV